MALCSASCYAPRAPPDHKRGYFAPAQQPPRFSLYQRIGVGQIKLARELFITRARAFPVAARDLVLPSVFLLLAARFSRRKAERREAPRTCGRPPIVLNPGKNIIAFLTLMSWRIRPTFARELSVPTLHSYSLSS